jgi:hypothetical protein
VSFVTRREELLQPNPRHRLAEFLDLGNHVIEFGLTGTGFRYDAGNRLAMSGNDDGLSALDCVERLGRCALASDSRTTRMSVPNDDSEQNVKTQ